MTDRTDRDAELATALSKRIHPMLAGIGPALQGAVLADLLATWIAGHPPGVREEMLTFHLGMVRKLIPVNARAIAARAGVENWES